MADKSNLDNLRKLKSGQGSGMNQTDRLIQIASECEFWHTPDGTSYVTFKVADYRESHPIQSTPFRRWIRDQYYMRHGKTPSSTAMTDALKQCDSYADRHGKKHECYLRVAPAEDGIYLDLGNDEWEVVHVRADGWSITKDYPVKFRRSASMRPLPRPEQGGSIETLARFANINPADLPLLFGWLVASLRPVGPYPVLNLQGPQGSAKSTLARELKSLVDPSSVELRTMPKDERDLFIAFKNSWCISFDNLSYVQGWLSDAFCRISTGGGFATRKLYADDDETIFDAMRPMILTGIGSVVSRSDLLDRSIVIDLHSIPDHARQEESKIWRGWNAERPKMLGLILDAISAGIRRIDTTELDRIPRMADFAKWGVACEDPVWPEGTFIHAYMENRSNARQIALDSDPVAMAIYNFMSGKMEWTGPASELLTNIEFCTPDGVIAQKSWPRAPHKLSSRLSRSTETLLAFGINIDFTRSTKARQIIITRKRDDAGDASFVSRSEIWTGDIMSSGDADDALNKGESKNADIIPEVKIGDASDASIGENPKNDAGDALMGGSSTKKMTLDDAWMTLRGSEASSAKTASDQRLRAPMTLDDANDASIPPLDLNGKRREEEEEKVGKKASQASQASSIGANAGGGRDSAMTLREGEASSKRHQASSLTNGKSASLEEILYPWIGKTVHTSRGPAKLLQVFTNRATVHYPGDKTVTYITDLSEISIAEFLS